jgi:hypothetical protein
LLSVHHPDELRSALLDRQRRAVRPREHVDGAGRVQARKVAVDVAGKETGLPMNDFVEIGEVARGEQAPPLYLRPQRIRSGAQRIVITVGEEPSRAGIDPRNLLIDTQWRDNTVDVTPLLKRTSPSGARAPSRS